MFLGRLLATAFPQPIRRWKVVLRGLVGSDPAGYQHPQSRSLPVQLRPEAEICGGGGDAAYARPIGGVYEFFTPFLECAGARPVDVALRSIYQRVADVAAHPVECDTAQLGHATLDHAE